MNRGPVFIRVFRCIAAGLMAHVAPALEASAAEPRTRGEGMRAYEAALVARRPGAEPPLRLDDVRTRADEGEALLFAGRVDEAVARLVEVVEHPRFEAYARDEPGRAAMYRLGDALAASGADEPARAYLRRVLATPGAWDRDAAYARRAVKRLVEIALESRNYEAGLEDLRAIPEGAPEDVRAEQSYLIGRTEEARGNGNAAARAYSRVPRTSRFWAQATYLSGVIAVANGEYGRGEMLFCKVADPKRQERTTPVLADEHFFAVRDLARLALGRVAHEQRRHDDARYYYYLVPRDSDRVAEALYESATTRYEKKDYQGARDLLDELASTGTHHRYEDEALILDAYVDLGLCRFESADHKLVAFLTRYEPVRDGARVLASDDAGLVLLTSAARQGADATMNSPSRVPSGTLHAMAALLRVDPLYGEIEHERSIVETQASGLRQTVGTLRDMQRALLEGGAARAQIQEVPFGEGRLQGLLDSLEGARRDIADLRQAHAPVAVLSALLTDANAIGTRIDQASRSEAVGSAPAQHTGSDSPADLASLIREDAALSLTLASKLDIARRDLVHAEVELARDAIHRLDLRLSRLIRRARLARIDSVLGRKRALEVEVEAVQAGYLPADAVDSMDAARYLKDSEEYWPFEGDDWPDEFLGGEVAR